MLTPSRDGSISSEGSGSGFLVSNKTGTSSRVANGLAVTTITRGWSAEADKLLDYLVRLFNYLGEMHTHVPEYYRRTGFSMPSRSSTCAASFSRSIWCVAGKAYVRMSGSTQASQGPRRSGQVKRIYCAHFFASALTKSASIIEAYTFNFEVYCPSLSSLHF